jgi:hypothetical protein
MQKPKPIEYVQAILYHIKYNWRAIVMAMPITATGTLELAYCATNNSLFYKLGAGGLLATLLTAVVIFAPELGKAMDKFRLREVPEDEEVQ